MRHPQVWRVRGYHDGVLVEKHQLEAMESEKMDTNASSSPGLVTDLPTPDENNPLMAALDNLARARDAKLVWDQRERFEKIRRRFDVIVTLRREVA